MIFYFFYEMFALKVWFVFIAGVSFFIFVSWNKNSPNFPPGPLPFPFLGNVFTGGDYQTMNKLSEKYGNVFSLRRGSTKVVYVSGYKMVKEALVVQGESFARCISPLFEEIYKGRGLSFANGYSWKKHQQFSIRYFKNFGEGGETPEQKIHQECYFLYKAFEEEQGHPFDPLIKINNAVANVIGALIFGHRHEYDDIQFQKLLRMSAESVYLTGSVWNELYDAYPSIMKLLPGPHHTIIANYRRLAAFLREKAEKHRQDWDPNEPRDYIHAYMTEIDKGTVMIANLSSVLHDKNEWERSEIFNPEHFLDSEGHFRRRDAFLAFSAGKRMCPGEYLARMELFLVFTCLLQKFTFKPPPGEEPTVDSQLGFTKVPMPHRLCASQR